MALGGSTVVTNTTLTNANTEYSLTVQTNAKRITLQARTAVDVRYAFVTGKVAASTPYMTLKAGQVLNKEIGQAAGLVIFLASSVAATVVETEEEV